MAYGRIVNSIVRQARLSDWEAISHFIDIAYGSLAKWKGLARWRWQFADNPFQVRSDDLVAVWIALDNDDVVGQIAVQAGCLQLDGVEHAAGWIVDVMILPAHRGTGLGHRLHDAVTASVPLLVTLTMAPATRRIATRAGCVTLAQTSEFAKLVHLEHDALRRYLLSRTKHRAAFNALAHFVCDVLHAHRLAAPVINRFLRWRNVKQQSSRSDDKTEIVEVGIFESELDRFWSRVRNDYPAIFVRNSDFLNWRFCQNPDLRYRCVIARRIGRMRRLHGIASVRSGGVAGGAHCRLSRCSRRLPDI